MQACPVRAQAWTLEERKCLNRRLLLDKNKTTGHIRAMPRTNVREQILAAGLATLHRLGFNATSVQDITDAAGVPKGSFYNHFESKEALGAEAVRAYVERGEARLDALRDPSVPALLRVRQYFVALNELFARSGSMSGCLLGNFGTELSDQSPLIRERVAEAFERQAGALAVAIAEAQKASEISGDIPPKSLASFLINSWQGAVMRAKVEQDRAPLDLFLDVTFAKILT